MKRNEDFFDLDGVEIPIVEVDNINWIALTPILDALKLNSDRWIKITKNDHFYGTCTHVQTVQIAKNGKIQARKVTCIPETFIYGWICFLNSDREDFLEYKKKCCEVLFLHFHGSINNRRKL